MLLLLLLLLKFCQSIQHCLQGDHHFTVEVRLPLQVAAEERQNLERLKQLAQDLRVADDEDPKP